MESEGLEETRRWQRLTRWKPHKTRPLETPARLRDHLLRLGLDLLRNSRRSQRTSVVPLRGMRFLAAVLLVYSGHPRIENAAERTAVALRARARDSIFVGDYGLLFWAEQRLPSGIAAVIMATIPGFMALSEILIFAPSALPLASLSRSSPDLRESLSWSAHHNCSAISGAPQSIKLAPSRSSSEPSVGRSRRRCHENCRCPPPRR